MGANSGTNTVSGGTFRHIDIVLALCRSAVGFNSSVVNHQVERLRDALLEDGDRVSAARFSRLLASEQRSAEMSVSRLKRSSAMLSVGEALTTNTAVPVDRETASPLAELIPVSKLPREAPIFDPQQRAALEALLSEWKFADALAEQGMPPPRTCLLYGAPGTGKTALALWIARELELPVVLVRLDGLISSFLGTTSRNIGTLFAFAARYQCVLLLDEFDAIAKLRDDPHEVGEIKRVVNTLLQNLDQRALSGLTIAITNHEGLLDPAVWRRFEVQLSVPRPAFAQRESITRRYLGPLVLSSSKVQFLAWITAGLSGAEIELLVRGIRRSTALAAAKNETGHFDFMDSIRQYASLNNGRLQDHIARVMMLGRDEDLARVLATAREVGFRATDIADILGVGKATVSRWLNKSPNDEPISASL